MKKELKNQLEQNDGELTEEENTEEKEETTEETEELKAYKKYNKKSPACRLDDETKNECVARKIPEILDENPDMKQEQAVAIAESLCSKFCSDLEEEEIKNNLKSFIKRETENLLEKQIEAKSNDLVKKFLSGVEKQRIIGKKPKNLSDQQIVKKWFRFLVNKDYQGIREMQKAGYLNYGTETGGGALVPPQLLAEVNRITEEYGIARQNMRYLPFSGPGNERSIPVLDESVGVYWVKEGGVKKSTKPSFKLVKQTLEKISAIVPLTEELLEDEAIDIIALLGELIGEAMVKEEDRVFFAGSKLAGDPYDGILNYAGVQKVEMKGRTSALEIIPEDLLDLMNAVPTSVRMNGAFYLSTSLFSVLQKQKAQDSGIYIVQSPVGDVPGTIWGKPYVLLDVLPGLDTEEEETPLMLFTDLKKTCVYGDKGNIAVKLLDQGIIESADESPSDLNLATQDMVALRVVKRVGYTPILPKGISVLYTGTSS